ncbi:MAG: SigB/SigF/SigG family RNA polymerase sigma factor [Acidimicrobiia bacterium]
MSDRLGADSALFEDPDRDRMFHEHLPLVDGIARRFRGRGEPVEDLRQVASIGLMKAVERFGPERGVPFRAYALATMVGEVKRHFRDEGWTVKVPRRVQELSIEIRTVLDILTQEQGRVPTAREIADYMGEPTDSVVEALAATSAYQPASLSAQGDAAPSRAVPVVEPPGELVDSVMSIEPGLARLDAQERQVVALRFFHDLSQRQIAERLGISQMQVSRLLARATRVLREWAAGTG